MTKKSGIVRWVAVGCDLDKLAKVHAQMRKHLQLLQAGDRTKEALSLALDYWLHYPRYAGYVGHDREHEDARCMAYLTLNATHQAAARLLMDLAESLGIKSTPIWKAAIICEELWENEPWKWESKRGWKWPECLGTTITHLPADERRTIRSADAIMEQIRVKGNLDERNCGGVFQAWLSNPIHAPENPHAAATGTKPRGKKVEAEKAIRHYIVDQQSYYDRLKPRCQANDPAAIEQAEKTFGRNKLAQVLVLSAGMVSSTTAWKRIKADLFCGPRDAVSTIRHSGRRRVGIDSGRVGLDIAEEFAGKARGDLTGDTVVRNETLQLIDNANMPTETAEQIINQLTAGDISDNAAREMIESYREGEASRLADHRPRRKKRPISDR